MTSQSPPAGDEDILDTALLDMYQLGIRLEQGPVLGRKPLTFNNETEARAAIRAYILSEIQKAKPEKDTITDDMVARTIAWHEGYNEGLDDYEQALTAKFGGTA